MKDPMEESMEKSKDKQNIDLRSKNAKRLYHYLEYSVEVLYDSRLVKTQMYYPPLCVVRRGSSVTFEFKRNIPSISIDNLGLQLKTVSKNLMRIININHGEVYKTYFECEYEKKTQNVGWVSLKTTHLTPVGIYNIIITGKNMLHTEQIPIFVIFNPFNPYDEVAIGDKEIIEHYLLHQSTKTHYGNEEYIQYRNLKLNQFTIECICVANVYLSRMSLKQRTSPLLVSRQIAGFVNNNDNNGLMSENRGNIISGKRPSSWYNMKNIYIEYLKNLQPVKWGQSFIYSALVTSLCRNIGIICRSLTGFSIGHDDYSNENLTVSLDQETLSVLNKSEAQRNIHCWNNVWLKRRDLSTSFLFIDVELIRGWQHLDGTPTITSQGIFQRGPFPISLLKSHIWNNEIPYDGSSIYHSLFAPMKYLIVGKDGSEVKAILKNKNLCIVTSDRFFPDIIITDEYMEIISLQTKIDLNDLWAQLYVSQTMVIGQPMKYRFKIVNSTEGSETRACLTLQLRDMYGKNLLDENPEKSFVFKNKNAKIQGEFILDIKSIPFDVNFCTFYWELKVFDQFTKNSQVIIKRTAIKPLFNGRVEKIMVDNELNNCEVLIYVENVTNLRLDGIKIIMLIKNDNPILREEILNLSPYEKTTLTFDLVNIPLGLNKIFVFTSYGACYDELGCTRYVNWKS